MFQDVSYTLIFKKTPGPVSRDSHSFCLPVHRNNRCAEPKRDSHHSFFVAFTMCSCCHLHCAGSRGTRGAGLQVIPPQKNPRIQEKKKKWKMMQGNYNPTTRNIAPTRMPNMDVDADNIPKRMYPAMTPIFNGVQVRLRFNLRIQRKDFVSGDISGLFFLIRSMGVHLICLCWQFLSFSGPYIFLYTGLRIP